MHKYINFNHLLNIIFHKNIFVKLKVSNCNGLQDNIQIYFYRTLFEHIGWI